MENLAVWFEIPVEDMERAVKFYQEVMACELFTQEMGGALMSFFPMEGYGNSGSLVKREGSKPSTEATVVYLNGGEDLMVPLNRVESAGGNILVPKTKISDENGFFAVFIDSEGNSVGLHSMK